MKRAERDVYIRSLALNGLSYRAIGAEVGCSRMTVLRAPEIAYTRGMLLQFLHRSQRQHESFGELFLGKCQAFAQCTHVRRRGSGTNRPECGVVDAVLTLPCRNLLFGCGLNFRVIDTAFTLAELFVRVSHGAHDRCAFPDLTQAMLR